MALVQLWMTEGIPYAFRHCPAVYASMRAWLARRLDIHPKEISMTGSGRLGESWVPNQLGTPFGRGSDLDLFLVSPDFFARIKEDFLRWRNEYRRDEVKPSNAKEKKYYVVCYLNSTPEWSRLKAAILRFTRVLSDRNVFTCAA